MLSSAAKKLFWYGRYMERLENTARVINAHNTLLFDLPRNDHINWGTILKVFGNEALFKSLYTRRDEKNIMRFMIANKQNPSSLLATTLIARENARAVLSFIPQDTWHSSNECYQYAKEHLEKQNRNNRYAHLTEIIAKCQQITGNLATCMGEGIAHNLILAGRYIERADMTSRMLDMGNRNLLTEITSNRATQDFKHSIAPVLWMSVLKSLNADQMYIQQVQSRVSSTEIIKFLIHDKTFPRSIIFCLEHLRNCLAELPDSRAVVTAISAVENSIELIVVSNLNSKSLSKRLDNMQVSFGEINNVIERQWFE